MKPTHAITSLSLVITAVVLLNGSMAAAQPNIFDRYANSPNVEDQTTEKLRKQKNTKSMQRHDGLEKAMTIIYQRFNKVELSGLLQQMKSDGINKRSFTAALSVSGAAFSISDLKEQKSDKLSRDSGALVLPFDISYDPLRSKVYLEVSLASIRNMNDYSEVKNSFMSEESPGAGLVLNKFNLLTFVFDNGFSNEKLTGVEIKYLDMELGNSIKFKKGNSIGIHGGLSGGLFLNQYYTDENGNEIEIVKSQGTNILNGNKENYLQDFSLNNSKTTLAGYGKMNYQKKWSNSTLSVGFEVNSGFKKGNSLSAQDLKAYTEDYNQALQQHNEAKVQYDADYASWVDQKIQWEADNHYTESLEINEYLNLSGASAPPVAPEKFNKWEMATHNKTIVKWLMLRPSVEYTKQFKKGDKPLSVGVGVYGNIPIQNKVEVGDETIDIRDSQRDMLKMSFFLKF